MSTHIGARPGQIAPTVLLPGDPLRARWIAENFLDDAVCHSEVRGMLGFTGTWHGQPVSVQGSGMGQPSMAIYVNELFQDYDVRRIIRVGSCGALTEDVALRDVVIASGDLRGVPRALTLGRATLRAIRQNLFWAFAYNAVGIPVAALGLFGRYGPMVAALAMAFSSVTVVARSALLTRVDLS